MECPACQTPVDGSQRFCPKCGALQPTAEAGAGADPMVGATLGGKYRIVKLLGEGGMGAVYVGEQQMGTKARRVAVKTLHPHLSKDPQIKARFQREVGTIAELEHPNTIQVYDFGTTDDGLLYLVMEFVDGTNVADVLEKGGAMNAQRTEKIMSQVCGSLEEAHSRGIVHRDLKPENVVLTERAGQKDFVKVLDFGIAKRSSETDAQEQKLTQQGMVLGTPPYMSPEQFTGKPIDARSDIYSLGVMMYEMLTARLPFNANTAWEWATQHMTVQPVALEVTPAGATAPPRMRDAIMRALEKDPARRWATVREFADAFAGSGAQPIAQPVPPSEPVKGKTQIGEPIMPPGGYGPPPPQPFGAPGGAMMGGLPPGPPSPPMMMQHPQGTPSAGNHAVPAIVPQAPPRERGGGGGRTGLLAAIGIIGVLSVGAIVYAVVPRTPKPPASGFEFDAGAPVQADVNPTTAPDSGVTPPPDVPPLDPLTLGKGTSSPQAQPHTNKADAGPVRPAGGGTTPPQPQPPPQPPPQPQPKPEPPECAKARALQQNPSFATDQALKAVFNSQRAACLRGGGHL